MPFKIKPPINTNTTPIYYVNEEENVLGRTNANGTITINEKIKSPLEIRKVIRHEMVHVDQIKRGDLSYDNDNVYWKGKTYPRSKMNEGAKKLPWEKEAYNKK
jgi:hypothetical protein